MIQRSTNVPIEERVNRIKKLKYILDHEEHTSLTPLSKKYIKNVYLESVMKDKKIVENKSDDLWHFNDKFKINKKNVNEIVELGSALCKKLKKEKVKVKVKTKDKIPELISEPVHNPIPEEHVYNNQDVANMIEEFMKAAFDIKKEIKDFKEDMYHFTREIRDIKNRLLRSEQVNLELVKQVKTA